MKYFLLLLALATVQAKQGFGPTEQDWGYVTVRDEAHLFWWLQQTSADVRDYTEVPVVIWLQGGPGSDSTGFGNFGELGPLDENLNPRATTWLNHYNLLFVDNPVGTGYSYVDNNRALATNNRQIADDFVVLLQGFYEAVPELKKTPLYIFCESYGGKMTAEIALAVDQAIKAGDLDITLEGVGLGDSWISPIDSVLTWGPYLLNLGFVDQNGYEQIQESARRTQTALANEDYEGATNWWGITEGVVLDQAGDVDFYNVLTEIRGFGLTQKLEKLMKPSARADIDEDKIDRLMANEVKQALGLNVTFGAQGGRVFNALAGDFMKPVTDIVELLLNTTSIKVAVYNGQLDLIVDTPGTIKWVDELKFEGSAEWNRTARNAIVVDRIIEGFYKQVGNLAFYWVNRAGHMVPADNPAAMDYILAAVTNRRN